MEIWVVEWNTESGDSGTLGYWDHKPTSEEVLEAAGGGDNEDVDAGTFYWSAVSLNQLN